MYANCYGVEGVVKAIQIMKAEILADAANAGVTDLGNVSRDIVRTDGCSWNAPKLICHRLTLEHSSRPLSL